MCECPSSKNCSFKHYPLRAVGQSGALQVVLAGKLRTTEASTSIVREAGHEIVDCMSMEPLVGDT